MQEWLPLIGNLILVAVTAWYAVLTRSLAKSARDSAESARLAAEYSSKMVAASVASVNVALSVAPSGYSADFSRGSVLGVSIFGDGATIYVHSATVSDAYKCVAVREDGASYDSIFIEPRNLMPVDGERVLPAKLHRGEALQLRTTPDLVLDERTLVAEMAVTVEYSLDGGEGRSSLTVDWQGQPLSDYLVEPGRPA